jgi:hypothetical protein
MSDHSDKTIFSGAKMPVKVSKISWVLWAALAVIAIGLGFWLFG